MEIDFGYIEKEITYLSVRVKYNGAIYDLSKLDILKAAKPATSIKICIKADVALLQPTQNDAIQAMKKIIKSAFKNVSIELHEGAKAIDDFLLHFSEATHLNVKGINWSGLLSFQKLIGQDYKMLENITLINIHPNDCHALVKANLKTLIIGTEKIDDYDKFLAAIPHNALEHLHIYCSEKGNEAYISQAELGAQAPDYEIFGEITSDAQIPAWGKFLFGRLQLAGTPALFKSIDIVVSTRTACFEPVSSRLVSIMIRSTREEVTIREIIDTKMLEMRNNIIVNGGKKEKLMAKLNNGLFKKLLTHFTSIDLEVGKAYRNRSAKAAVDAIAHWLSNCKNLITLVMNDRVNLFERTIFIVWLKRRKDIAVWNNLQRIYGRVTSAHIASIVFYLPAIAKVQVSYLTSAGLDTFFKYFIRNKGFTGSFRDIDEYRYMEFESGVRAVLPVRRFSWVE